MTAKAKENIWYAVERLGLPTVLCLVVTFICYQAAGRLFARYEQQIATQTEQIDKALESVAKAQSEHRVALVSIEEQLRSQAKAWDDLAGKYVRINAEVRSNDRRITRREDNQFTAQDGSKMQMQVSENSTLIAQLSQALADNKGRQQRLEAGMQKIWEAVRRAPEGRK